MSLLDRLRDHSIVRYLHAASLRYNEATRALRSGDRLCGVYLCGYVAEMLLKTAYFRVLGWAPRAPILLMDLRLAQTRALTVYGLTWSGNLHDLAGWSELLIEERNHRGHPYTRSWLRSYRARVRRIKINWSEQLRYHPNKPYEGEVNSVFEAATWLLQRRREL